jgi:hypothetical protein
MQDLIFTQSILTNFPHLSKPREKTFFIDKKLSLEYDRFNNFFLGETQKIY